MLSGRTKLALINSAIQREMVWCHVFRSACCRVTRRQNGDVFKRSQSGTGSQKFVVVWTNVQNNKFTETVSVENTSVSTVWARGSQDWQNFTVLVQSETSWWTFNSWSEEHLPQEVVETRTELKEESSGRTTTRNQQPGNKESNYSHL